MLPLIVGSPTLARNADEMMPVDTKEAKHIDLRCDLCGRDCTEVLNRVQVCPNMSVSFWGCVAVVQSSECHREQGI